MTAPSDGSALKPAPVDIEAGKARLGLRPGTPIGGDALIMSRSLSAISTTPPASMPPFWASSSRGRLRAGASSETAFTCVSSRILPQDSSLAPAHTDHPFGCGSRDHAGLRIGISVRLPPWPAAVSRSATSKASSTCLDWTAETIVKAEFDLANVLSDVYDGRRAR
jgi:hypothetical protein